MNRVFRLSAVLIWLLALPWVCAQQREPETPSLGETGGYIGSHLSPPGSSGFYWTGTDVKIVGDYEYRNRGSRVRSYTGTITFDVMNVDKAYSDVPMGWTYSVNGSQVLIGCRTNIVCVTLTDENGNIYRDFAAVITTQNAVIRDNVVRALNHFFRLVQQQNTPTNDPFASPQ